MKKVKVIVIIACIVILALIGVLLLTSNKEPEKETQPETKTFDILSCASKAKVTEFIEGNQVEDYTMDDQYCTLYNLTVFEKASDVEVLFQKDAVSQMIVSWELYDPIAEQISNGEITEEQQGTQSPYPYTKAQRESSSSMFQTLKKNFEERFGVELQQCDRIPAYEGASLEDTDEVFFQGSHIREYSVRDQDGILWLLRFEICGGIAQACLLKLVDETGYEGFIPMIDLTKAQA